MKGDKKIFLDFDGVIVTPRNWRKGDQKCIAALNRLTDATKADIVVSSAWRVGRDIVTLREILKGWGVKAPVIDRTPYLGWDALRGDEIDTWLKSHRGVEQFVILDDRNGMRHLTPYLIQTNMNTGLTQANVDEALMMLGEEYETQRV